MPSPQQTPPSRFAPRLVVGLSALAAFGVCVGLALAATVSKKPTPGTSGAQPPTVFTQSNSLNGAAIVHADRILPGVPQSSMTGTVTIGNTGNQPGYFKLSEANLNHPTGPAGGDLSARLQLRVTDLANPSPPIYEGPLGAMSASNTRPLGVFEKGQSHSYRFQVTFPSGSSSEDNQYQGATTGVDFVWSGVACPATSGNGNANGQKNCGAGARSRDATAVRGASARGRSDGGGATNAAVRGASAGGGSDGRSSSNVSAEGPTAGAGSSGGDPAASSDGSSGSLPFTGLAVGLGMIAGLGLVGGATFLRLRAIRPRS